MQLLLVEASPIRGHLVRALRLAACPGGAAVTWTATATVAVEPAGHRISKRIPRDVYHLVASQRVRLGSVTCGAGEPLCGTEAALLPCPDGLFPPSVTCHICAAIATREHISISGTEPVTTTRRTT